MMIAFSDLCISNIVLTYCPSPIVKYVVVDNELNDNDVYPTTEEKKGAVSEVSSAVNRAYFQNIM
jgi:hypothetical protein